MVKTPKEKGFFRKPKKKSFPETAFIVPFIITELPDKPACLAGCSAARIPAGRAQGNRAASTHFFKPIRKELPALNQPER